MATLPGHRAPLSGADAELRDETHNVQGRPGKDSPLEERWGAF